MDVVHFEEKYYEKLLAFSKKLWPEKPEEYLKFRLFDFPEDNKDVENNLLVINDDGEIIGCILMFVTKARIYGKEVKVFWGHDLIVEERYRGEASLYLMVESGEIKPMFGFGASEINKRIQKELGTPSAGWAKLYLIFNFWTFKAPLIKLKILSCKKKDNLKLPQTLIAGKHKFEKVDSVKSLKIPENGYWSNSDMDIEFVRDEHFLDKRFFNNLTDYTLYKLENNETNKPDECYFVVRSSIEGGFPVLSVVDFRFNIQKPEQYKAILKAASKLGRSNRFPLVTFRTSVDYKKIDFFPFVCRTGKAEIITTNFEYEGSLRFFVTNADSDSDFLSLYK
ncbi:MAG TPA: hypothetical protein PLR88_00075 [Bacteroidales bacterium]|nr:hypothetical protein [Bacteroidales bacterium]HPT20310.1 hypothetical protein [Bacteroidales bacterium]